MGGDNLMPTSFMENIPKVIEVMQRLKPKEVLDIGIGNGKYGLLAKEYVPSVVVDGVEAYAPYITDIHKAIYRQLYLEDVTKMNLGKLPSYDLYLMIDVIEHVPKAQGHTILKGLNGIVLVSTPVEDYRAHYDNHFEDHVSHWTLDDFKDYAYEDLSNDFSTMVLVDTTSRAHASQLSTLRAENKCLQKQIAELHASNSWKATRILRKAKRSIR